MSTSISLLNNRNIVTNRNSTNNCDNDRNSSIDSGDDSNGVNEDFNEGYSAKMTHTQDKSGMLIDHGTTTSYTSGLKPGDYLVSTSLYVKELAPNLRPDITIYIKFT